MNPVDAAAIALIVLFALVIAGGLLLCGLAIHWRRSGTEARRAGALLGSASDPNGPCIVFAVRSRHPARPARPVLRRRPRSGVEHRRFAGAFGRRPVGHLRRLRAGWSRWEPPAEG